MPLVKLNVFGGIRPSADKRQLPVEGAQTALNCSLGSGALEVFSDLLTVEDLGTSGIKSIYPYNNNWLNWTTHVNVVKGPLADDQYERIYYTGDGGKPKIRFIKDDVEYERTLGVAKPSSAPTLELGDAFARLFSIVWGYFYEEEDGTQKDLNAEEIEVEEYDTPSTEFGDHPVTHVVLSEPTRHAASQTAVFMPFADIYSTSGNVFLGRIVANDSKHAGSNNVQIKDLLLGLEVPVRLGFPLGMYFTYVNSNDDTVKQDRRYVYTFVTELGEEGPPSDPSEEIQTEYVRTVRVTCPDSGATTDSPQPVRISYKRIYRTVTSDAGTQYQYVGQIAASQTLFYDNVLDAEVGEVLPTVGWIAPDEDLEGLVSMPGGFLAGFVGKTVYFSEVNYPHAWPIAYAVNVDFDIVGLAVSGNTLMVMTEAYPYQITAMDPATTTVLRIPANQACVSSRGIVEVSGVIVYPSPDGIVVLQPGNAVVYSSEVIDKETWQSWLPDEMVAAVYDGEVYMVSSAVSLVFPILEKLPIIYTISDTPLAMYYDPEADALYMVVGTTLYQWDAGAGTKTAIWRSREWFSARPNAPVVGRVVAAGYPVTMTLYAEGVNVLEKTVNHDVAFRLPVLRNEKAWFFELSTTNDVYEVLLSASMGDL